MPDSPVIDMQAIERLRTWGGEKLPRRMVEIFLENAPDRIGQIRQGVEDRDTHLAGAGAHSLKSSAGNLGATRVQALCQAMEVLAESGDLQGIADLLPGLEGAHGEAREELLTILGGMDQ